ncbi:MAG: hypothetical protein ACTHLE_04405 [Agriterribacter sp.]
MELKTFIEETLVQIVEGVKAAQNAIDKEMAMVMPQGIQIEEGPEHVNYASDYGYLQKIHFSVVLSIDENSISSVKGGVKVLNVGAEGNSGKEKKESKMNSIKFKIPIHFSGRPAR